MAAMRMLLGSAPAVSAVRAGQVMSVTLGVILAHTGTVALALIHPHTSCVTNHHNISSARNEDHRLSEGSQRLCSVS